MLPLQERSWLADSLEVLTQRMSGATAVLEQCLDAAVAARDHSGNQLSHNFDGAATMRLRPLL